MPELPLTQMKVSQTGIVREIAGGSNVARRLEVLGVRPGKAVTKVSAHFWRGPVTVKVNSSLIAIGYGMAAKVMVEVKE